NELDDGSGSGPTGRILAIPLITGTTTDFRAKAAGGTSNQLHLRSHRSSSSSSSSCLIDELLLGKLSETVVIIGNAPDDRPGFLVVHLIGNRACFLCTIAPMRRVQKIVSGHQAYLCRYL